MSGGGPSTLVERARQLARRQPDHRLYTFLGDGEEESACLTAGELDRRARSLAAVLQELDLAGERALLLYPSGLDLVVAFFACLYAGTVAVPAYPPRHARNLPRLAAVASSARPALVLTSSAVAERAERVLPADDPLRRLPWLETDALEGPGADAWADPDVGLDHLAFLQYTSGSTAAPKGVALDHGNLVANQRMIQQGFGQSAGSVIVGWLPLQHDMGLIGNLLQPLWLGARCVLMPPTAFLQRPRRWLEAITRYRATTSGGPDFAYRLCVDRIGPEERDGLDLTSWTVAFDGAEPVRPATLDEFTRAFASHGFDRRAFYPCYGLAEATLFVAGPRVEEAPTVRSSSAEALERDRAEPAADGEDGGEARRLAGCGAPRGGQEIAIVDGDGGDGGADEGDGARELPARHVGEIWVRGANVARGYWAAEEATAETFGARLDDGRSGYLRTGDLGFVDGGELYVTGRAKDLIILRGRNVYPQDVETAAAAAHPGLHTGDGAAFSVEVQGEERLVVVSEIDRQHRRRAAEAVAAVARAVTDAVDVRPHEVLLLPPGALPKTTSGKVRRRRCRELYLDDSLRVLARSGTGTVRQPSEQTAGGGPAVAVAGGDPRAPQIERWLLERSSVLVGATVAADTPVTELGLDSLGAMELAGGLERTFGVELSLEALLQEGETVASLAVLAARSAAGRAVAEETPGSTRDEASDVDAPRPLTPVQRGLWASQAAAPASRAFQIAVAARVEGPSGRPVDVAALARALRTLAARHEALATTFVVERGEPLRRRTADPGAGVVVESAAGWSDQRLLEHLAELARQPFDLARGPLFRARVLDRDDGTAALGLTVHHLVADLWSLAVLAADLEDLYAREAVAGATGDARSPVELPTAARESDSVHGLDGPRAETVWAWWGERLGELPAPLRLPADAARSGREEAAGGRARRRLPPALTAALAALARHHRATPFAPLLAGLQVVLGRWSRQGRFLVGVATAGRGGGGGGVGFHVETLPLVADLADDPDFTTLVERVCGELMGALAHAGPTTAELAHRFAPVRTGPRGPLYDVLVSYQTTPSFAPDGLAGFALGEPEARLELGRLSLAPLPLEADHVETDLALYAARTGDGALALALEHRLDRLDPATAERLLESLEAVLTAAVGEPGRPVSRLPLMADDTRRRSVAAATVGPEPASTDELLHTAFFRRAGAAPDRTAVVDDAGAVTYGELARRARRIAGRLRRLDPSLGADHRVGVHLERSADLVATLLGVLAAGAAYVPLPVGQPAERLALLARDAGATALVTRGRWRHRLPPEVPWIDLEQPEPEEPREADPRLDLPADCLAYLVYTSGSTGHPKGVAIRHRSAAHLVAWARGAYRGEELAGVLAATSISFDLSVFELFVPLSVGGTVIVAEDATRLPAPVEACPVTLVNTVPSVAAALLDAGTWPVTARTVNLAGEALPSVLVERLAEETDVERVWNLYGPSEDTTYSTAFDATVSPPQGDSPREPAIGRPLPGGRVHVVDGHLEPVPRGMAGELLLGGAGLARGYLGRAAWTAERFVPDPFARQPGERLYRTGDLVRRRADDGELHFLGRLDHQVKIRGFRIEPGEVEAALLRRDGVREAVVVPRRDTPGGRLVAYVAGDDLDPAALAADLGASLPGYLVPAAWVVLPALPRNPHGKVDRRALPEPDRGDGVPSGGTDPADERTAALQAIFAQLLEVERVGVDDDFFARGGHSLLAFRLLFEIREAFGVELAPADVFEHPTPVALARRLTVEDRPVEEPIRRDDDPSPPPVSFGQRRLWWLDRLHPGLALYHVPGVVQMDGPCRRDALGWAVDRVVERHESLRTRLVDPQTADGEPRQEIDPPPARALGVVDLTALAPATARRTAGDLASAEARRPFDLGHPGREPLARFLLLAVTGGEHRLVAVLHHAVCDGASLALLLKEIAALYRQAVTGRPVELEPLALRPSDVARWQRRRAESGELDPLFDAWRQRLAGAPPALDLPVDHPRPRVPRFRGRRIVHPLPPTTAEGLGRLARQRGVTPFVVWAAAAFSFLARLTGDEDLVVGTPASARTRRELEPLVGFFVETLPLRVDLADDPPFVEVLRRTRAALLDATRRQEVPFERLVEALGAGRDLAREPIFQVLVVVEEPFEAPTMPQLDTRVEALDTGTAKFPLTLALRRSDEGVEAVVEIDLDLFEEATGSRLAERLTRLLAAAMAEPEVPVSRLSFLGSAEERRLLVGALVDPEPPPVATSLHGAFFARAAETPDAPALHHGDATWSYGEVARRVRHRAARLATVGVGPERVVAVALPRTSELVVTLLAVQAAGGASLGVDLASPAERIVWMLADADVALVVAEDETPWEPPAGVPRLAPDAVDRLEPSAGTPREPVAPGQLAYLIYTSGSTGRPKAVAIEQRSAGHLLAWARREFSPAELEGVLAATSISFDLSVFELFVPLALGGSVVLAEGLLELPSLGAAGRVTLVNTVPSVLDELLRRASLPAGVVAVDVAGEALSAELARRVLALPGPPRLRNLYGPSEDTTYSTGATLRPEDQGDDPPPIGHPLPGTRALVLDRFLGLRPDGAAGELCLGGAGLARGYLGRPALTAERFVPDPTAPADDPGRRLYRTGDRVRRQPATGVLDYLGRLDRQVKIRGLRIEPGEVEAALERLDDVRRAVVLPLGAAGRPGGGDRLVAFVVPDAGVTSLDEDALRASLGDTLPGPLIPSLFVPLSHLPFTINGKLDRAALTVLADEQVGVSGPKAAPRSPLEEEIAGLFSELLEIEEVGIYDDFFRLGGHSLLAHRLQGHLLARFGVDLAPREIFAAPTVAALSVAIARVLLGDLADDEAAELLASLR